MAPHNTFTATYKCGPLNFLAAFRSKAVEDTGRLIVPDPIAEILTNAGNVTYPVCFKLTNKNIGTTTYCSLYDYGYQKDVTYMPTSVMNKLQLKVGDDVEVKYVKLSKATAVFIETQVPLLMTNENAKLVVRKKLWDLTCLNEGDMFTVNISGTYYSGKICKIFPNNPAYVVKPDVIPIYFIPIADVDANILNTGQQAVGLI